MLTLAAFQTLVESGIDKEYATELVADIGWKIYISFLPIPKLIAKLSTRDPQKQIDLIIRLFMIFPFSTPGRPGYECNVSSDSEHIWTDWTYCPPFAFVQHYVEMHGDRGELNAFRKSWCDYDWALAYAMVDGGYNQKGFYHRPHALSEGDRVCNMCWSAKIPEIVET